VLPLPSCHNFAGLGEQNSAVTPPMPSLLIVRLSGIARPEMVGALDRLRRGERAG